MKDIKDDIFQFKRGQEAYRAKPAEAAAQIEASGKPLKRPRQNRSVWLDFGDACDAAAMLAMLQFRSGKGAFGLI